ncbi:hypothetical protein [Microbacterium sp. NIBRBAC000506063]|uniref:hypothetical protein n=1 Tax=Microbacterium sp. NIBRBAC000506063 TaxID=2734618 RepID=UPI001BB62CD2|nr:hypothetical protein [Microbacterium sp. NIBRBAC000506063]QTV80385.1 hypothetical protein KAE78_05475 [Microbacterium sp. NIBRBAC000506063]
MKLPTTRNRASLLADFGPLVALILLCVIFTFLNPQFASFGNIRNILDAGSVLAVIAVGITFVLMMGPSTSPSRA